MEGEEEVPITLPQLVEALDHWEEEAREQHAQKWGEEGKCTYNQGYIQQPVYACETCFKQTGITFGFCFGCSMTCHLDHQVFELFKKRSFRCDCPTPSSNGSCQLNEHINVKNLKNAYNHNFNGIYCWCNKPYDCNEEVVMIQCYMCQDWFHEECIKKDCPYPDLPLEEGNDFICKDCINSYGVFLKKYFHLECLPENCTTQKVSNAEQIKSETPQSETISETIKVDEKRVDASVTEPVVVKTEETQGDCFLTNRASGRGGNVFFMKGWRNQLCRCAKCLKMYTLVGTDYLLNEIDGEDEESSSEEHKDEKIDINSGITEINPTVQREIAAGMMEFKQHLVEFLQPFLQKRTVTARVLLPTSTISLSFQDIEDFKSSLLERQKKRRKHE